MTQILVPTLGESVSEATVANWLKKEGETVKADEPIVELETDKVTLEVNAPSAGVISRILAPKGSNVGVGAILGEIGMGSASNDVKPAPAPASAPVPAPAASQQPSPSNDRHGPAVRKMAEGNKIDTSIIDGSGKDGRVTKGDLITHMAAPMPLPAVKSAPVSNSLREERVKMTRLRQSIAKRLKEAQNTAAMLTTFNEIDMTAILAIREQYKDAFEKKHGVKLGFMSFFVKAAVNALKEFPAVNASIEGDDIIYKNYYDLGVAVSTPQGLVVPVVRDCDSKSMAQIEKDIGDMGKRARDGKLGLDEMQGGTFTITNGGVFGSLMSTPILNAPQSGILGMHKTQQRAIVMPNGDIKARPMMYIAMSYDHRIIDGREAVTFLVRIKDALEDPQRLLLDM